MYIYKDNIVLTSLGLLFGCGVGGGFSYVIVWVIETGANRYSHICPASNFYTHLRRGSDSWSSNTTAGPVGATGGNAYPNGCTYAHADSHTLVSTNYPSHFDSRPHSNDRLIREANGVRIRQACEIARQLEVRAIILYTNFIPNFYQKAYREDWVDRNEE